MEYWWVNHKQTFKKEFEGGYIWSPRKDKNSSFNQTYANLLLTSIGDIVFSFASAHIKAIGVVERNCIKAKKPKEFLSSKNPWNKEGYLVKIKWTLLEKPFKPKNKIKIIRSLLPVKYSPIQKNGNGNQKCYLAHLSVEFGDQLLKLIEASNPLITSAIQEIKTSIIEGVQEKKILANKKINKTEKLQLIKARIGQGLFRQRVITLERKCRLTGLKDERLLIASHIKPWRYSNNIEKLDGNNGLLLSPHIDRLFDKGWISFENTGDLLVANNSVKKIMENWNIASIKNVGEFNHEQTPYIEYHRKKVYKKKIK